MNSCESVEHAARILVVDDAPPNLRRLERLLTSNGYRTELFQNGAAALKVAGENPPDLILLDLRMPEMDGFEVCSRLKENNVLKDIPVIFIGPLSRKADTVDAFNAGGVDYITRPFHREEVLARVKTHLSIGRLRRSMIDANDLLEERVRKRTAELKKASAALRASEERYRKLLEAVTAYVYTVHLEDLRPVRTVHRTGCEEITGYTVEEFSSTPDLWLNMIHDEDRPMVLLEVDLFLENPKVLTFEHRILRKDGSIRWVSSTLVANMDKFGRFSSYEGVITDITERKLAEEKIRESLADKIEMLKEIHHRVKNNLQIISSLLSLQANLSDADNLHAMFAPSQSRIMAMSLVHEMLYSSQNFSIIDAGRFIRALPQLTMDLYSSSSACVNVDIEADDGVSLSIDKAIPCGLIANELLSNSFKYAFQGRSFGSVRVSLRRDGGDLVLTVADDGLGLPEGFDVRTVGSLGLQLVSTLAKQMHGKLTWASGCGASFSVRFPATQAPPP